MAGLLLMGMYWPEIVLFKEETLAAGKPLVANGGPASILCTFPNPNQTYVPPSILLCPAIYAQKQQIE